MPTRIVAIEELDGARPLRSLEPSAMIRWTVPACKVPCASHPGRSACREATPWWDVVLMTFFELRRHPPSSDRGDVIGPRPGMPAVVQTQPEVRRMSARIFLAALALVVAGRGVLHSFGVQSSGRASRAPLSHPRSSKANRPADRPRGSSCATCRTPFGSLYPMHVQERKATDGIRHARPTPKRTDMMPKPEGGLQSVGYALGDHDGFGRTNDLPPE